MTDTRRSGPVVLSLANEWPVVLLIGIITLVVGGVVLAWPQETLTAISVLLGIQLLVFGVYRLVAAFGADTTAPWLSGFVGVLSLISGVIVVRHPFETIAALAVILGAFWVVTGAIDLIAALTDETVPSRGRLALSALVSLTAGILVVAWPAPTIAVLAWIAGLYLVIYGLFIVYEALVLRRVTR